jgi:hypothetical protein
MSQLSPCPQCRSERVWARAALGAYGITHVAFCPGCARAATICTRCGTELVLMRHSSWPSPGRPRVETTLQCPSCRQPAGSPSAPVAAPAAPPSLTPSWPAAPSATRRSVLTRFVSDAPAPAVMQRVADDCERLATTRYVRQRTLLGIVEEAARRADVLARLEVELGRIDDQAA